MPIGDIAGEALGGVVRVVGRILFEIVFEFIIRGTGYVLIRLSKPGYEPGDTASALSDCCFGPASWSAGFGCIATWQRPDKTSSHPLMVSIG
jgi:hypothetical protein